MQQKLRKKAKLYVGTGSLLEIIYFVVEELFISLSIAFLLIGILFIIIGCVYYSKSKGYSSQRGFFLGLLGILGFLFLSSLPDKTIISENDSKEKIRE